MRSSRGSLPRSLPQPQSLLEVSRKHPRGALGRCCQSKLPVESNCHRVPNPLPGTNPAVATFMTRYAYHTTYTHRLESIARLGLLPGAEIGLDGEWEHIWFCDSPDHYPIIDPKRDIQLRFRFPSDAKVEAVVDDIPEYVTAKKIPPRKIDVLDKGEWVSLVNYFQNE
jgi:hypothetical protein